MIAMSALFPADHFMLAWLGIYRLNETVANCNQPGPRALKVNSTCSWASAFSGSAVSNPVSTTELIRCHHIDSHANQPEGTLGLGVCSDVQQAANCMSCTVGTMPVIVHCLGPLKAGMRLQILIIITIEATT